MSTQGPGLQPFGNRLVVRPVVAMDQSGLNILIPETVKVDKPQKGAVVAVGDGYNAIPLSPGDSVLFVAHGPDKIEHEGEEFYLVRGTEVLARLEGDVIVS